MAAVGMVKNQAQTILKVTPHRTAEIRLAEPTPEIAPVITWVVLTGMPMCVAKKILAALAVSAQKPSIGLSLVIFWPMVLTILQPPLRVPRAIAEWALKTTHNGMANSLIRPPVNRTPVIMPIVF